MQEMEFKAQSNSAHAQLAQAAKSDEENRLREVAFEETAVLDDIRRKEPHHRMASMPLSRVMR